jgi:hypothetical protein
VDKAKTRQETHFIPIGDFIVGGDRWGEAREWKKRQICEKELLTHWSGGPYKALNNEGGAPLAPMSSPSS